MTGIEDRLAQALRARTDLVTADRLTPAEPPVAARAGAPWRRPAAYALVAAACAATVSAPFLLLAGDGDAPGPVETPSPTAGIWQTVDETEVDLDGDGSPERAVLSVQKAPPYAGRVELPDEPGAPQVDLGRAVLRFGGTVDIDQGLPGRQLLVTSRDDAGSDGAGSTSLDVLAWADGSLVAGAHTAEDPDTPALTGAVDEEGRDRQWWVQGDALMSSRSLEPVPDPAPGEPWEVAVWVWELRGDKLAPQAGGTWCHDGQAPPQACEAFAGGPDEGFAEGASPFRDVSRQVIDLESGDSEFLTNLDGGGDDLVRLFTPGDVARLEVVFDDGTRTHVDIDPPQAALDRGDLLPTVHTTYLAARTPMLVVRWGGLEGVTQVYDPAGHELRPLSFTSVLGGNRDEDGAEAWSVLTEDGSFYVLRRAGDEAIDVYRWEVQYDGGKAAYLFLGNAGKPIGRWCADGPEGAGWVTCT